MIGGLRWSGGMSDLALKSFIDDFVGGYSREVCCPKCAGLSRIHFVGKIALRGKCEDINAAFAESPFEVRIDEWEDGEGCTVTSFPSEGDEHPDYYGYPRKSSFIALCTKCHERSLIRGQLRNEDLYWSVQTRHGVLWARNRRELVRIRDFIAGVDRPRGPLTNRLPAAMLKGSNRDEMIKLIDRVLHNGPGH